MSLISDCFEKDPYLPTYEISANYVGGGGGGGCLKISRVTFHIYAYDVTSKVNNILPSYMQ